MGIIADHKGRRPTQDAPQTPLAPRIEGGVVKPQKPSDVLALRAKEAAARRAPQQPVEAPQESAKPLAWPPHPKVPPKRPVAKKTPKARATK